LEKSKKQLFVFYRLVNKTIHAKLQEKKGGMILKMIRISTRIILSFFYFKKKKKRVRVLSTSFLS
jgi:hypothetical protein